MQQDAVLQYTHMCNGRNTTTGKLVPTYIPKMMLRQVCDMKGTRAKQVPGGAR